ncbi:MAG: WGR domain-containing protein [Chloroflexota bacterium]
MDWQDPPTEFRYILFERHNRVKNEMRFYYLAWQPTLLAEGAIVRVWGRKHGQQRVMVTEAASLDAAWPTIRALIRTRLRHGYRVVGPEVYRD